MYAIVKGPYNVKIFVENRFLWLHCIDLESRFELTVKSFPLLKLKFVYGHFSFMRNLSEQRLVVFPHFTFFNPNKVVPEEISVIWDFERTVGMTGAAV